MDLYSAALGLAIAAAGASALAAVAAWAARSFGQTARTGAFRRLARACALASLAIVTFSIVFHLLTGHAPGTPEAMTWREFLLEHRALPTVVLLATAVLGWLHRIDRSG